MIRRAPLPASRTRSGAPLQLAALAVLVATSCSAGGSDSRLIAVHNTLQAIGLGEVGHISQGSLTQGNAIHFPMDLEAQCYTFVAFGGDGARDIDLAITDANNARVAGDTTHDSQATVQFCPPARARFTVTLRMAAGNGTYALSSWRGAVRGASAGGGAGGTESEASGAGTCQTPTPIAIGQTVTGDTRHARHHNAGTCLHEGEAPEIVYVLQLDRRLQVTVAAEQDYDGALYIRTNCDDPNSEVPGACNDDDGDTSHSRIVTALDRGTYYIFADGFDTASGSFTLSVTGVDVPSPQDVCQSAAQLTAGQALSGQTSGEVNVFQATCANGAHGPDHVYRLDVPQESRLQLFQESDYDGVLYLRRACADQASEIACNDDAEDTQHSRINTVIPQGTYYVFTDGFSPAASGNFTLEADLAPIAGGGGLAGDTCTDAQPLTAGQAVDGNTFQAHDDVQSPCGAPQEGYDVVYRLNVANRSRVRLWFEHSDMQAHSVIYLTRSCTPNAANASVACRAGATGDDNALDAVVDRGQYYVVVDSQQPRAFGRFRLMSRVEDQAVLERVCRAAPLLHTGQTVRGTTSGDDRFQSSCAGGSRNPENLYRIVLRRRSFVRLALTADPVSSGAPNARPYDPSLYIRANCTDPGTERACNDDAGDQRHSLIEATLDAGTYTVFVDGFGNHSSGSYTMEVTIHPQ